MKDSDWDGVSMQSALLNCEIVEEARMTDVGPGPLYYLKLGSKVIPLGISEHFADMLQFALRRNARAFEKPCTDHDELFAERERLRTALFEARPYVPDHHGPVQAKIAEALGPLSR